MPNDALENLCHLLDHEEFAVREKAIWILKHAVDNQQEMKLKIIDRLDPCLIDSEFAIRNTAATVFVSYWTSQVVSNDQKMLRIVSARIENFLSIIFRQRFSLSAQLSGLEPLENLVKKKFVISETLVHLIGCCLYDREESISTQSIAILQLYSKRVRLPRTTLVCLEHLLTTETSILGEVISILKSIVADGHILSKKAVEILGQLLFTSAEPQEMTVLLTHADRNQPLPKSIDTLLRQIYYGNVLRRSTCEASLNKAMKELLHSTSQGQALSASVLDLILLQLDSLERRSSLMPILVNVVSNGQQLNKDHHRSVFEKIFLETSHEPSVDLMEIFTHLTRQNQVIPDQVIVQLEKYLNSPSINRFVVEIYQHLIERQKPLDRSIIDQVFRFFDDNQWKHLEIHELHSSNYNINGPTRDRLHVGDKNEPGLVQASHIFSFSLASYN